MNFTKKVQIVKDLKDLQCVDCSRNRITCEIFRLCDCNLFISKSLDIRLSRFERASAAAIPNKIHSGVFHLRSTKQLHCLKIMYLLTARRGSFQRPLLAGVENHC